MKTKNGGRREAGNPQRTSHLNLPREGCSRVISGTLVTAVPVEDAPGHPFYRLEASKGPSTVAAALAPADDAGADPASLALEPPTSGDAALGDASVGAGDAGASGASFKGPGVPDGDLIDAHFEWNARRLRYLGRNWRGQVLAIDIDDGYIAGRRRVVRLPAAALGASPTAPDARGA